MWLVAGVLLPLIASSPPVRLTADHLYNGLNRPFMVTITTRDAKKVQVALLKPLTAEVVATADAAKGSQDLGKLFPALWTTKTPSLLYAQVIADGKRKGSALVLQPMLNPAISRLKADGKTVEFVADEDGPMFNGYRAYMDQYLALDTVMGHMEFCMRPDAAPNTAWTIMQFAAGGLYDDTVFHRVVAKRADGTAFVIQGGDPTGTGSGGPGFAYPLEDSPLEHDFGVISIARSTDPNTNGCQFFVCLSREGTKHLDHRYASFGQCVLGADTILKIGAVPVGDQDRPTSPPKIVKAYLVPAPPYGEGRKPVKRPS